jgi:GAF domain-containing protein
MRTAHHPATASVQPPDRLHEILVALGEPTDLNTTLQMILDHAVASAYCDYGWIGLIDSSEGVLRPRVAYAVPREQWSDLEEDDDLLVKILGAHHVLNLARIPSQPEPVWRVETTQSVLCAPLLISQTPIGGIILGSKNACHFTAEDGQTLELLAAVAAIAVELSRLRLQSKERNALQEVSNLIIGTLDVDAALAGILEKLKSVLDFDFITVSLVDRDKRTISTRHGIWDHEIDKYPDWVSMARYSLDDPDIQADIVRTGETEIIDSWDSRFNREIWDKFGHDQLVRVFMPIKIRGQVIGTVEGGYYRTRKPSIDDDEIQTLEAFVNHAAIAIENAAQIEALKVSQQQQAAADRDVLVQQISATFAHQIKNAAGTIPVLAREARSLLSESRHAEWRKRYLARRRLYKALDLIEDHATGLIQLATKLRDASIGHYGPGNHQGKVDRPGSSEDERSLDIRGPAFRTDVNLVLAAALKKADLSPDVKIIQNLASPSPTAQIDRDVLLDILMNIIRNADEAMGSGGGQLHVATRFLAETREVLIEVQDTGPGILADVLEQLFRDTVTTKTGRGMGYGLFSAQKRLQSIGGRIKAKNLEHGGAKAEVWLPASVAQTGSYKENGK